jgi:exonuclease III
MNYMSSAKTMRIFAERKWNQAIWKRLSQWFKKPPDILCLQETKAQLNNRG